MAHGHVAVMAKPFNPLNLAPTMWFDASDSSTITASSGKVSQWNDKSGNARHATQSTSANQPATGSATQNSLNVLTFTASSTTFLTTPTAYDPSAVGIAAFFVSKATAAGVMFQQLDSSGTGRSWLLYNNPSPSTSETFIGGVSTQINTGSSAWTLHRITVASGTSKTLTFARNAGALSSTNTVTIEASSGGFHIGGNKPTPPTSKFDGNIAEILIYPTLSAAAVDEVERYLNAKWAIY